jgi:integrase
VLRKHLGLDIRTDGGAIAAPPSQKANGAYRWADHPLKTPLADPPRWLLQLAIDPPPPPKPDRAPLRRDTAARMARYVEAALDGECGEIAGTKSGGRNQRLYTGAIRLGELVGAKLLPHDLAEKELYAAADRCGLVREDGAHAVRITIDGGLRKGIANPREVAS